MFIDGGLLSTLAKDIVWLVFMFSACSFPRPRDEPLM